MAVTATVIIAYGSSFHAPWVFDDVPALARVGEAVEGGRIWDALWSANDAGETTSGRPLLFLSLVANYLVSGRDVFGYHLTNLAIHLGAGALLFDVVRRTIGRISSSAATTGIALAVSAWWLLHPLQTQSVTYTIQRAESLGALFYLGTIAAFVRAQTSPRPGRWLAVSVLSCLLGVATKETVATAPLIVLVYDRLFVAGTFRAAWVRGRGYYLALAAAWLPLLALIVGSGGRGGTAGFDAGITVAGYAFTQAVAVTRYLALAVWPTPLIFDYGTPAASLAEAVLPGAAILIALGLTGRALARGRPWALASAWFFLVLAPSSSVVPIASQTIAEHRVYLALAGPMTIAVMLLARVLGRRAVPVVLGMALSAALLTAARNRVYGSAERLWTDTVAKRPDNARAHLNLGLVAYEAGRWAESIRHFERSLAEKATADAHYNLGLGFARLGDFTRSLQHYDAAIALRPGHVEALNNAGTVRLNQGDAAAAVGYYERATLAQPKYAPAHANLAHALLNLGDAEGASRAARRATEAEPKFAQGFFEAGNAAVVQRRFDDAERAFSEAVKLAPSHPEYRHNLATALAQAGRFGPAREHFERAVQLRSEYREARRGLSFVLLELDQPREALAHLEWLARAAPEDREIARVLQQVRAAVGR